MPNLNQKGPMGEGSMTGRKKGRCSNYDAGINHQTIQENDNRENPTNENVQGQRLGLGMGRGMGQNREGRVMGRSGGRGKGMDRRFRGDIQE